MLFPHTKKNVLLFKKELTNIVYRFLMMTKTCRPKRNKRSVYLIYNVYTKLLIFICTQIFISKDYGSSRSKRFSHTRVGKKQMGEKESDSYLKYVGTHKYYGCEKRGTQLNCFCI